MKYWLFTLSLIGLAGLLILASTNQAADVVVSIPPIKLNIYTNMLIYTYYLILGGYISGMLLAWVASAKGKEKINPYKRQLEKLSVQKDGEKSKVEVLEAKIKTLEAALEKSLNNNG